MNRFERQLHIQKLGKHICDLLREAIGHSKKLELAGEFFDANEYGLGFDFVAELAVDLPDGHPANEEITKLKAVIS